MSNRIVTGNSVRKVTGNSVRTRFSRLPETVLEDKQLSLAARVVYAVLALRTYQGTTARIGQRQIAEKLGIHQETVSKAIQELVEGGHISILGDGNRRRIYHLTSEVFGARQRAGVTEVATGPSGQPRLVSVGKKRKA